MDSRKFDVVLTREAIYDIVDISNYIEDKFGTLRADKFQEDMKKQINDLSYMGYIFSKTGLFYQEHFIYKKLFSPSIIFYIIEKQSGIIHVLRVLRQEQNWEKILNEHDRYTY